MANKKLPLTVILGFRDRGIDNLDRCLAFLSKQTFSNFEVIVVDYGSVAAISALVKKSVGQYNFCRYVYSDTRGYPWSRSRALNIGARLATSEYLMTSDVDIIFPNTFLEIFMEHADKNKVLHCYPHFLKKGFKDWDNLKHYIGKLPTGNKDFRGIKCVTAEIFEKIRGYDEYYRYWGAEDIDINSRFKALGLEEIWLTEKTAMFHQWHTAVNWMTPGFMPEGVWGRISNYKERNKDILVRNPDGWGRIVKSKERVVFNFLDLEKTRLIRSKDLNFLELQPNTLDVAGKLTKAFWQLSPGQALAVNHTFFPGRIKLMDTFFRVINGGLYKLGINSGVDFSSNRLHSFAVEFIEENKDIIADYFLEFPILDGVTVIVRR